MAKKKLKREKKNKLIPEQGKFKGDLVNDNRPENYELSEEFTRNNPMKTPPSKKQSGKKK